MPVETKISFSDGGSTETFRKLSDESSRKHLSDLLEADEEEITTTVPDKSRSHRLASTTSTHSMTAMMEALWEKHPRRLSEAGLRRSSDHSVILTEDTDSFIIGERVWVGGTKPGQIAYIGETQFAPGEWAGIVLDEPIGKNDGSVAGIRYFQCPEKRGVFSRLTRLTRVPLVTHTPHDASPVSDASSVFERPPSGSARPRRTLSPNGSVRSIVSSKMNASISTTTNGEVRMGDRVIVSSSRGSKAGTLRYVGTTDFAPGIWAGVELDDPLGKNNGSVDGKRYFECAPRFGLFAPISKVSRSPSNRKPGACAIHSNGRATPLRRSNSRESLTSLGTSIASSRAGVRLGVTSLGAQRVGGPRASSTPVSAKNALQELLREKQQHLERLLRERELERSEVAKISLQADRAESALAQLKKEAAQANTENGKLKAELDKINKLLEDEKQKVEDLMFRNEEENINKEDYNKYKEAMEKEKSAREQRIVELEAEASLQRARAEAAAAALRALDEQRQADANAAAYHHKEELNAAHTLSSELQKLLDEAYALLREKENEKDSLGKSMSDELMKVKVESEKALNEAKMKMAIAQTEYDTQVSVLSAKLQLIESKLETEKQNLERANKENSQTVLDLNSKLTQLQAMVDDKTLELNKVIGISKEHEVNLNKEITKLKMELSAKLLDLEQLEDSKKKQETNYKSLQDEIVRVKEEYTTKVNEYENLLNEVSQENERSNTEIMELKQSLTVKTKEYEKLLTDSSSTTSATEKLISEYRQTIHERDKEIIKLKDDFEQATANFNIKHSKIAEEHKKEIEDRNTKIEELIKEIENHKQTLDQNKIDFDRLNSQFLTNADELKVLQEENAVLKEKIAELNQANADLKVRISEMELEVGDYKRQLESANMKCEELQKAKEKVETEYLNLTGQTSDSNEQFNELSQHLKNTEKELQDFKDKHREALNNCARIEQESKQKLIKLQDEYSCEKSQYILTLSTTLDKLKEAERKVKDYEVHFKEVNSYIRDLQTTNDILLDQTSILSNQIEGHKQKECDLKSEHEGMMKLLDIDLDKYRHEISVLETERNASEKLLKEKVDQFTEVQNNLNNKLEEARQHEDSLQKVINDMTGQLSNQKLQHEKEIAHMQSQLLLLTEENNAFKMTETALKKELDEKVHTLKDLTLKLEMLDVDLKSNLEIVVEKDRQISQVNEELNKTIELKKQFEEKFNSAQLEISTLKQQYENLIVNSTAEETILSKQLDQLEILRKEIAVLVQDKISLEIKNNETLTELTNLTEEHALILNKLNEYMSVNNDIRKALEEKENLLQSQTELMTSESISKFKELEEELNHLKEELTVKNTLIKEREVELTKLNEVLHSDSNESLQMVANIQAKYNELEEKYKKDLEYLNDQIKHLQNQITEKEKEVEEFLRLKETVDELQSLVSKSDRDVKQLTNINEAQKQNYEDLNNQLQSQFDDYKKESKNTKQELIDKIGQYEKELEESKENIKVEIDKQNELKGKLLNAENKILELSQKLELVEVHQSTDVEKDSKLEKLTMELQAAKRCLAESVSNNEILVNNLKADIERKIRNLKEKDDLILLLQEEVKNQKAKIELIEKETLRPKEAKDKNDNNAMGILGEGDNVNQTCLEEKEMIDGQVSFLNSVIVDMQRKNEQLMARVQALEGATVVNEPPLFNGKKARAIAPRLFCDICDVFDAHDTEECPRQAADEADGGDGAQRPPGPRRTPPPPRPYCDICEVFGHSTENCDEEETF